MEKILRSPWVVVFFGAPLAFLLLQSTGRRISTAEAVFVFAVWAIMSAMFLVLPFALYFKFA